MDDYMSYHDQPSDLDPRARKVGHMLYELRFPTGIGTVAFEPISQLVTDCLAQDEEPKVKILLDDRGLTLTGDINSLHDIVECMSSNGPRDLCPDDPYVEALGHAQDALDRQWGNYTKELRARFTAIVTLSRLVKKIQRAGRERWWRPSLDGQPGGELHARLAETTQVGKCAAASSSKG